MFNAPKQCRKYVEANPYMPHNKIREAANYLLSQKEHLPRSFSLLHIFNNSPRWEAYGELVTLARDVEQNYDSKMKNKMKKGD